MATRSRAWAYDRLTAKIVGSNPPGACLPAVNVVFCQVDVSATG